MSILALSQIPQVIGPISSQIKQIEFYQISPSFQCYNVISADVYQNLAIFDRISDFLYLNELDFLIILFLVYLI